jgi:peptide/nickel transport system substrate-binding protein
VAFKAATLAAMLGAAALAAPAAAGETPKYGGSLIFMIPADAPPSFDAHREGTFATVHSAAPFYSVLIRVDPNNPSSTTDFVCDLCAAMPQPTDGGKTYTFKIRNGVKFHDGSPLTAPDVAASWEHIIHPPEGILSPRESHYMMVDTVEAPDPTTVVFHLKFATAAFLPALADPYSWIYKKEILDRDPRWYEKNILGSGPFKFAEYETGQSIKGVKNPDYYHNGLPYLDGFTGIYADKQAVRVEAIRGDRAAIEFRGFPPAVRDELVGALGEKITVQESDWNCGTIVEPNHKRKPFDDATMQQANMRICALDNLSVHLEHKPHHAVGTIVTIEDVGGKGKPAPDLFLESARRLDVPAKECMVFEDSDEGIEAARRAGMMATDVCSVYRPAWVASLE